jgi:hypothetical protein
MTPGVIFKNSEKITTRCLYTPMLKIDPGVHNDATSRRLFGLRSRSHEATAALKAEGWNVTTPSR